MGLITEPFTVLFNNLLPHQTLDLLCRITNATNVEIVCSKLIGYLRVTVDSYFRAELVTRVTELAERYPLYTLIRIQYLSDITH